LVIRVLAFEYLGVPVVNIGTRQNRRLRGKNVVDVGYDSEAIKTAIKNHINSKKLISESLYGDGASGTRIAKVLAEFPLQFHKTIMY
jgi:UDP-N-acetylglucosamine 2-epimerase/N-acetylmannosamine kinase